MFEQQGDTCRLVGFVTGSVGGHEVLLVAIAEAGEKSASVLVVELIVTVAPRSEAAGE